MLTLRGSVGWRRHTSHQFTLHITVHHIYIHLLRSYLFTWYYICIIYWNSSQNMVLYYAICMLYHSCNILFFINIWHILNYCVWLYIVFLSTSHSTAALQYILNFECKIGMEIRDVKRFARLLVQGPQGQRCPAVESIVSLICFHQWNLKPTKNMDKKSSAEILQKVVNLTLFGWQHPVPMAKSQNFLWKKTASERPETSKKAPGIPRIPAPEHPVLLGDFIRPHGVAGFDTGGLWRPLQWPWTKHPKKRGVCNGSQVHLNFIDTFVPFWFNHASNRSESADVLQKKTSNTNGYTKAILRSMYGMFTYMYH